MRIKGSTAILGNKTAFLKRILYIQKETELGDFCKGIMRVLKKGRIMAGLMGFEPMTCGLKARHATCADKIQK